MISRNVRLNVPRLREADVEADVGDAAVGLAQEEHRALDAPPLEVAVRRLAEHGAEAAAEVRLGHVGDGGDGADVERLGVGAVHGVAGAQEAPVEVLDVATHRPTLRHHRRPCVMPPVGGSCMAQTREARGDSHVHARA